MPPLTIRALLLLLARPRACSASSDWSAVDSLIHNFHFLPDVSFSAGNSHGRLHTFTKGKLNMQKPVILASSSKFPAALAIMGVVADPQVPLTFDTRINEVFDWWSTDPRDNRSLVTLRHLLTFTSGMVSNDFGNGRIGCLDTTPSSRAYAPASRDFSPHSICVTICLLSFTVPRCLTKPAPSKFITMGHGLPNRDRCGRITRCICNLQERWRRKQRRWRCLICCGST